MLAHFYHNYLYLDNSYIYDVFSMMGHRKILILCSVIFSYVERCTVSEQPNLLLDDNVTKVNIKDFGPSFTVRVSRCYKP